jgi:hypothetical protein
VQIAGRDRRLSHDHARQRIGELLGQDGRGHVGVAWFFQSHFDLEACASVIVAAKSRLDGRVDREAMAPEDVGDHPHHGVKERVGLASHLGGTTTRLSTLGVQRSRLCTDFVPFVSSSAVVLFLHACSCASVGPSV